jgi:hypothetical protein
MPASNAALNISASFLSFFMTLRQLGRRIGSW